ncbi:MAG: M20/M25/M40 family metallo-hydrolase [Pleurocapsa minor GSE-CHR-MK-17-07R]|jgi:endoglucanase|nr:M20/M25/M40 family metallo-hydrolase [Pleurocapsa minor GSE-CHR-MK 17-07R]
MMKTKPVTPTKKRVADMTIVDTLKNLVEAWGPSGHEHGVREIIRRAVLPYADEVTVDPLGNLICRVGKGGKRIMVAAHMDEIGVMVTFVEKNTGFLRFANIGGLLNTALLGSRVQFENGVVGTVCMPEYFTTARTTAPALDQYYIDASDGPENPSGGIEPGMPAVFLQPMIQRGSRIIAKSLDDRSGCAVLIETMRRLNKRVKNEMVFVFTVQEEVGVRGARPAAYSVEPDYAIAVDVTPSGDMIGVERNAVKLGGGAAVKLHDTGHIVPPAVRDWIISRAEADGIPYQRELISLGTTDAAQIQLSRAGVPSGAISIPCRYVHTASETVDTADLEACVQLLTSLSANPAP